jgi:hypothetical protein
LGEVFGSRLFLIDEAERVGKKRKMQANGGKNRKGRGKKTVMPGHDRKSSDLCG